MKPELEERIKDTEKCIEEYFERSKTTMLQKNQERGDCWRNSGLLGQFIEIHSMYFRLRRLIWDMGRPRKPGKPISKGGFVNMKAALEYSNFYHDLFVWKDQITNALEDLRNFTMLAELCLEEDNWRGDKYTSEKLD
jgi:hypothetical protein